MDVFFFKQKTAYEVRISDWSSDVCSSDLARRNEASKLIGQAMAGGDKDKAEALKAEVAELKTALPAKEEAEREQLAALHDRLAALPNLPADDVPDGEDEEANVEISRWGTPRSFDFAPQEHADFAPALGLDFETAAKMSGARFARSEEHTSELQSLMRISYAVFCLKKTKNIKTPTI